MSGMMGVALQPIFSFVINGPICTLLASIISSASCCIIIVVSYIDRHGLDMLKGLYRDRLPPCAKLVVDGKEYQKRRHLLIEAERYGWKVLPASFKTHDKLYIAISAGKPQLFRVTVASGSANLTGGEVLCRSVNNLTVSQYLVNETALKVFLSSLLSPQLYENIYLNIINDAITTCKTTRRKHS